MHPEESEDMSEQTFCWQRKCDKKRCQMVPKEALCTLRYFDSGIAQQLLLAVDAGPT